MIARCLVWIALTHCVGLSERNHERAILAQESSQTAKKAEGHCQECPLSGSWKEEAEISESGLECTQDTPFLSRSISSPLPPISDPDDVVLSCLQNSKQRKSGPMQQVQGPLVAGMDALDTPWKEQIQSQEQEQEQGSEDPACPSRDASSGILGGFSKHCPMDTNYPSRQKQCEIGRVPRCTGRGSAPARAFFASASKGSNGRKHRTHSRRVQALGQSQRSSSCRDGIVGGYADQTCNSDGEGEGPENGQSAQPWTSQQAQESKGEAGNGGQESQRDGCGMGEAAQRCHSATAAAQLALSGQQTGIDASLQYQSGGSSAHQAGAERCLSDSGGPRRSRSDRTRHAGNGGPYGSGPGHSLCIPSAMHIGRRDGGGASGRWSRHEFDHEGGQEGWQSETSFPGSGFSLESCQPASQTEDHPQDGMISSMEISSELPSISLMGRGLMGPHPSWSYSMSQAYSCDTGNVADGSEDEVFQQASTVSKRVRFYNFVQVHAWQDEDNITCTIPCCSKHDWARSLWHLDGQIGDWILFQLAFQSLHKVSWSRFCLPPDSDLPSDQSEAETTPQRIDFDSQQSQQFELTSRNEQMITLQHLWENARTSSGNRFVEFWYLCSERMTCCIVPRKFQIEQIEQLEDIEQIGREVWNEQVLDEPMEVSVVPTFATDMPSTFVHVILQQRRNDDCRSMLLHSQAFPILRRKRAILYEYGMSVLEVFDCAQVQTARLDPRTHVFMNPTGDGRVVSDQEPVVFENAASVQGEIRRYEVESDEDASDSESESDATTAVPHDAALSHESSDDETTLMSLSSPVFTFEFDQPGAYPWLNSDEVEEGLSDEDTEEDCHIPHDQVDHIEELLETIRTRNADAVITAVTYGLGIADLGRRDVTMAAGDLRHLRESVYRRWQDHAQHGRMELLLVTPQPLVDLVEVVDTIVLMVVINFGGEHPDDTRALVLTHAVDMEVNRHPFCVRFPPRVSAATVTAQLGLHDCFPLGVRDCIVRQRGEHLSRNEYVDIEDGSLVTVSIHAYPPHVRAAQHLLMNSEDFYLHIKQNQEQSEPTASESFVIRAHGISPQNNPLGSRDLILEYDCLQRTEWTRQVAQLWPFFDSHETQLIAVIEVSDEPWEADGRWVYHIIVSYARHQPGVPVLVRQTAVDPESERLHEEYWAIKVRTMPLISSVFTTLRRPRFWFPNDRLYSLRRNGRRLEASHEPIRAGEFLDFTISCRGHEDLFHLLLATKRAPPPEMEAIAFLQTWARRSVKQSEAHEIGDDEGYDGKGTDPMIVSLRECLKIICAPGWIGLNYDFAQVPDLHPMAVAAIQMTSSGAEHSNVFHVYTDGSSKGSEAAWSFVVLAECWQEGVKTYVRVGYSGGKVRPEDGKATAANAEALAIIAAAEYILSRQHCTSTQIHLHYDATAVGHAATGTQRIPVGDNFLVKSARVLISLIQRKNVLAGHHVHAHEGAPWNEFVDSVAGLVRSGWQVPIAPVLRYKTLMEHPLAEWAWLEIAPDAAIPSIETILRNEVVDDDPYHEDPTFRVNDRHPKKQQCTLKLATANVGTMLYVDQLSGDGLSQKATEILAQCNEHGLDIVAVQESRARHSQTLQSGPYVRYISQGLKGQAGVELWLHVENLKEKLGITFDPAQDAVVWHQDHRCLAIHFDWSGFCLNVVVVYAPQKARPLEETVAWWQHLDSVIEDKPGDGPLFLLGDCNCSVGSVTSDCIDDFRPDQEDEGGRMFRELCDKHQMIVPSTFSMYHNGSSSTFTGPRGSQSRIDYIAVDQTCAAGIVESRMETGIDLLNGVHDHCMLSLTLQLQITIGRHTGFARTQIYDRQLARKWKIEGKTDPSIFMKDIPWERGVNSHWHDMKSQVLEAAARLFPKQKRHKRQLYISEDSWKTLCQKKDVKAEHMQVVRALQQSILRQCFNAWSPKQQTPGGIDDLQIHTLQLQDAQLYEQRNALHSKFRAQKRADWKNWVSTLWEDKVRASKSSTGADIYKIFQPKKMIQKHAGRLRKPLPGMMDGDRKWLLSRQQVALAWQSQFAAIENANEVSREQLHHLSKPCKEERNVSFLRQIPSLYAVEKAVKDLNMQKAPGADGIGAELWQLRSQSNIEKIYALFLKTAIRGQAVADLTGGWLVPLHKGRTSPADMTGYRAILLEASIARSFSKSWRPILEEGLSAVATPGQWGSLSGHSIEAVHLQLKLWQSTSRALGKSLAILFVDLRSAFYSVVKPLLAGFDGRLQELIPVFQALKLPAEAYQQFVRNIHEAHLIQDATKSLAATQMVAATLRHTWFALPGGQSILAPQTGSRPGDPLADILFSFLVARMTGMLNARLEDKEVFDRCPNGQHVLAPSVAWVDDLAFAIQTDAESLVSKTALVFAELLEICTSHGFSLSYGQGKTAILMEFRGPKATKCRQKLEENHKHSLPIVTEFQTVDVPLVSFYKHLGGNVTRQGHLQPEIALRSNQACAKLKPLMKLTRDPGIEANHRRMIIRSFAMPVLTLHAGTWFSMNQGEFRTWQAAVFKVYAALQERVVDGKVLHHRMYDLAKAMQAPMPMELLHHMKLRLFTQILKTNDHFLISAILHNHEVAKDHSWLHSLQNSVRWLQDQIGRFDLPDALFDLTNLEAWDKLHPCWKTIKKQIKQAVKAHLWRVRLFCELHDTNEQHKQMLSEMGWTCRGEEMEVPHETQPESHVCGECDRSFATQAALATHQQRKHGGRVAARRWANDSVCRHCNRQFHTRPRLIQHWHHGQTDCWFRVFRGFVPMTKEQTEALDMEDKSQGKACHQRGLRERQHDLKWRVATADELQNRLQPTDIGGEHPPTEEELEDWRQCGFLPPGRGGRAKTVRVAQNFHIHNAIEDAQKLERDIVSELPKWTPNDEFVPRPFALGQKYYLVFFSGHRRWADLPSWIQWQSDIVPISIDLAISESFGNLLQPQLWLDLIMSRKVIGGHGGPPCETFTDARWLPHDRTFPRPLRTSSYPWLLLELVLKEVQQGALGSILFLRTTVLLLLIYMYGGCFSLEHPKGSPPGGPKWSIWMSGILLRMGMASQVHRMDFLQGPLGQPFSKPTTFYYARLPTLPGSLYSEYDLRWKPSMVLGGICKETGRWKTSAAKAYPERLCKALAHAVLCFADGIEEDGEEADPANLTLALAELCCWDPYGYGGGEIMCSDYNPNVQGVADS